MNQRRAASPSGASTSASAATSGPTLSAVAEYTHAGAFDLNARLRNGDTSHPLTARLDAAFGPLDRGVDVQRVVSGEGARLLLEAARTGRPYTDPGFMSTQKQSHADLHDAIDDFAPGMSARDIVVIRGRIPTGARAIDVGNPKGGLGYDQGEVLLPRGTQIVMGTVITYADGVPVYGAILRPPK